ncbi:AraC family transcriptional regulator [Emticicia sp. C21]|uniref:helix-turn-helix domain-containing protein n=1 Tax=Emticicia sp. C21 TaxID=2302915 RepID=UPI0011C1C493|nr:helix-turn-helix domain-containing protein [Emticicia sp. C21]
MLLFLCHAIWVYTLSLQTNDIMLKDQLAEGLYYNRIKKFEDILSVLSGIIYWVLSFSRIQAYKHWLNTNISNASYPTYSWLRNVLIAMGVLVTFLMINIPLEIFFNFGARHFIQWQFFYFYLAVLVYYLGFTGYQQKDFEVAFQTEKRSAMTLNTEQISTVKEKLLKAINEDKVFLDAELNLNALARQIGVGEGVLSAIINEEFYQNFRNFINEKRVEEVKRKLLSQEYKHLSILGIALESGFNSEASFYRVFKGITGQSPKDFLQKNNSQNPF